MSDLTTFLRLIGETVTQPAQMAGRIMARPYDRGTLWMGVTLVSILSVLLIQILQVITPFTMPMGFTPLLYGLVMGCILIILTMGLYLTGQMLGGQGTFTHSFALVIWLEVTALTFRVVQAVVGFISPGISGLLSFAGLIALLWIFLNFVNEVHKFNSFGRAFATIVIAIFGIGFGFGLFLSVIGVSAQLEI
ncbi:MAG: YIP1 family protein [Yoonia sp.]|nr:YIP1 family protein [Yoonia sp.]